MEFPLRRVGVDVPPLVASLVVQLPCDNRLGARQTVAEDLLRSAVTSHNSYGDAGQRPDISFGS